MRLYTPLCRSVGRSVGESVSGYWFGRLVGQSVCPHFTFWRFSAFWAYYFCPVALLTFFSTTPAHPHATGVAVYPALFSKMQPLCFCSSHFSLIHFFIDLLTYSFICIKAQWQTNCSHLEKILLLFWDIVNIHIISRKGGWKVNNIQSIREPSETLYKMMEWNPNLLELLS